VNVVKDIGREKALLRNLALIAAGKMLSAALALSIPTIVLLWQSCGLSYAEITALQACFAFALALLEVPSGYLADVLGRRGVLIAAAALNFLANALYCVACDFWSFLAAELLWSAAFALQSGADQALVHDSLLELGQEHQSSMVWGRICSRELWGAAAFAMLGGFLGAVNLRWPLILSAMFVAPMAGLWCLLVEPKNACVEKHGEASLGDLCRTAKHAWLDRELRWLMLFPAVLAACNQTGLWLYQPYFQLNGIAVAHFGFIFALFNGVAAISSRYAYLLQGRRSPLVLVLVQALGYLLMATILGQAAFGFIVLHQWVRGFSQVYFTDAMNHRVSSARRATLLSLQSLCARAIYAVVLIPAGHVADGFGVQWTFAVLAMLTVLLGLPFLLIARRQTT